MVYRIFHFLVSLASRFYFKKIVIQGSTNIPEKGPVLLICNHPSSFFEAIILACFQHRTLHFLVRGDMFEKKWLKPILESTYQIPIYRSRDGFEKLRNNISTFEICFNKLSEGHAILIFPEGSTLMSRNLRPLQKGAARLAIGSLEAQKVQDLMVVPCGMNYSDVLHRGGEVRILMGSPMSVTEFLKNIPINGDKLSLLTQQFYEALDKVVLSAPAEFDENRFRTLEIIYRNSQSPESFQETEIHQKLLTKVAEHKQILNDLAADYSREFTSIDSLEFSVQSSFLKSIMRSVELIISFILGIPGIITLGLPLIGAKIFTLKKIKHIEFVPPVRLALSLVLTILTMLAVGILGMIYIGIASTLILVVGIIFSLYLFNHFLNLSLSSRYLFNRRLYLQKSNLLSIRNQIISILSK
jgi:1-acyl-sn-glycerol-3-phosphate acyltransferase